MATHSSILAWEIPRSPGVHKRVGYNLATKQPPQKVKLGLPINCTGLVHLRRGINTWGAALRTHRR